MIELNDDFLAQLGLSALPTQEKDKLLAHIFETLELRVGMKLAEQMTDAQLDEFESLIDQKDDAGAKQWLESNFPHYKDVVLSELENLKTEIKTQAPAILEASGVPAQSAPQPPVQVPNPIEPQSPPAQQQP